MVKKVLKYLAIIGIISISLLTTLKVNGKEIDYEKTRYKKLVINEQTLMEEICENEKYNLTKNEIEALQKIALAEAESEGLYGMAYVMQVVLNRVESEDFENSIIDVIKEKGQFESYTNGRYDEMQPNYETLEALYIITQEITHNTDILYFETVKTKNSFMDKNKELAFIYLNHKFYK